MINHVFIGSLVIHYNGIKEVEDSHLHSESVSDHLLSGKDVLLLGANNAYMAYMGTDTIDDVDVDKWNGCLYIKEHDTTYNATYWFTGRLISILL